MIKLLIFDFDGTVADSAEDIVGAALEFFEKYDRPPVDPQTIRDHIGLGLNQLLFDVFGEFEDDQVKKDSIYDDFLSIYERRHLDNIKVYPGLETLLAAWPHKIALVSNKLEKFLHTSMKHLRLDRYEWVHIFGRDSLAECKPHPLPLLTCCESAGVRPFEALMIGDGLPDVGSAAAAEIQSIAVDFGYSPTHRLMEAGANHLIKSYDELPQLIKKIESEA